MRWTSRDRRDGGASGAVAAVELLAAAAPTRVVAADVAVLVDDGHRRAHRGARLLRDRRRGAGAGGRDRLGALDALVLVGERLGCLDRLQLALRLVALDLDVVERE